MFQVLCTLFRYSDKEQRHHESEFTGKPVVGPLLKRKLPPVSPQLRSISCRLHVYNTTKNRCFLKRIVKSVIAYVVLFTTTSTTCVQLYVLQSNLYFCFGVDHKLADCALQYQRGTTARREVAFLHDTNIDVSEHM